MSLLIVRVIFDNEGFTIEIEESRNSGLFTLCVDAALGVYEIDANEE